MCSQPQSQLHLSVFPSAVVRVMRTTQSTRNISSQHSMSSSSQRLRLTPSWRRQPRRHPRSSAVAVQDASGQVAYLESLLDDYVYQYDVHVQLLQLLRSQGEVDALRRARERMAHYFALSSDLWQQWLEDEKSRVDDELGQRGVLDLYLRACSDYLVPGLWLDCIDFAEQLLYDEQAVSLTGSEEADSLTELRKVMETAATAMSCHRLAGESVMKKLRAFELRVLTRLLQLLQQDRQAHGEDDDDDEHGNEHGTDSSRVNESRTEQTAQHESRIMRQVQRVKALYRRSLSQPVLGLEQVYADYQRFCEQQQDAVEDDMTRLFKEVSRSTQTDRRCHNCAMSHLANAACSCCTVSWLRLHVCSRRQNATAAFPTRRPSVMRRSSLLSALAASVWSDCRPGCLTSSTRSSGQRSSRSASPSCTSARCAPASCTPTSGSLTWTSCASVSRLQSCFRCIVALCATYRAAASCGADSSALSATVMAQQTGRRSTASSTTAFWRCRERQAAVVEAPRWWRCVWQRWLASSELSKVNNAGRCGCC